METHMQKELLPDFLHLYHSLGSRRSSLVALLEHFSGEPGRVRSRSVNELKATGLDHATICSIGARRHPQVANDLSWAERDHNHLICFDDDAYPELLRQINDYPALLYVSGNLNLLHDPQIAIVGSRHCTPGGAQNAFEFAYQLASAGLTITSGMALGIDASAHLDHAFVTVPGTVARGRHLDRELVGIIEDCLAGDERAPFAAVRDGAQGSALPGRVRPRPRPARSLIFSIFSLARR